MPGDWVDFKEIKEKVTIEMVLGRYGILDKLKRSSKGLRGPCPIHKGTHANQFHVDPAKNRWNCFGGCDMEKLEGHVIGFVAAMEQVSLREAALKIATWFGLNTTRPGRKDPDEKGEESTVVARPVETPAPQPVPEKAADPAPTEASHDGDPENKELTFQLKNLATDHPFFKKRGILPETVAHFGLGFCTKGMMKDRIVFPIHRHDGKLIGYTGRTVKEVTDENPKWLIPTGLIKPKVLLNFHRVVGQFRTIILVEGGLDIVAVHQVGFPNVAGLLGSDLLQDQNLSYDQVRLIANHFDQAVLLLDGDKDGREGMQHAAEKLMVRVFVRTVTIPDDKDPSNLPPPELKELLSFLS
jgi:DNA primase